MLEHDHAFSALNPKKLLAQSKIDSHQLQFSIYKIVLMPNPETMGSFHVSEQKASCKPSCSSNDSSIVCVKYLVFSDIVSDNAAGLIQLEWEHWFSFVLHFFRWWRALCLECVPFLKAANKYFTVRTVVNNHGEVSFMRYAGDFGSCRVPSVDL